MITKREESLMRSCFSYGFDCGMNDKNNGYSNLNLNDVFDEWINEVIADNGALSVSI